MKKIIYVLMLLAVVGGVSAGEPSKKVKANPEERWTIIGLRAEMKSINEEAKSINEARARLEKRMASLDAAWVSLAAPITSRVLTAGVNKAPGQQLAFDEPSAEFPDGALYFIDPPAPPSAPSPNKP